MCYLLRFGPANDRLDCARAAEIMPDGAAFKPAKFGRPHVAEIIPEGVARIRCARTVAEDVSVTVQFNAELLEIGTEHPQRSHRENAADWFASLASLSEKRLAGRAACQLGSAQGADIARVQLRVPGSRDDRSEAKVSESPRALSDSHNFAFGPLKIATRSGAVADTERGVV